MQIQEKKILIEYILPIGFLSRIPSMDREDTTSLGNNKHSICI